MRAAMHSRRPGRHQVDVFSSKAGGRGRLRPASWGRPDMPLFAGAQIPTATSAFSGGEGHHADWLRRTRRGRVWRLLPRVKRGRVGRGTALLLGRTAFPHLVFGCFLGGGQWAFSRAAFQQKLAKLIAAQGVRAIIAPKRNFGFQQALPDLPEQGRRRRCGPAGIR